MGRDWPVAELLEKPADPAKRAAIVDRLLSEATA